MVDKGADKMKECVEWRGLVGWVGGWEGDLSSRYRTASFSYPAPSINRVNSLVCVHFSLVVFFISILSSSFATPLSFSNCYLLLFLLLSQSRRQAKENKKRIKKWRKKFSFIFGKYLTRIGLSVLVEQIEHRFYGYRDRRKKKIGIKNRGKKKKIATQLFAHRFQAEMTANGNFLVSWFFGQIQDIYQTILFTPWEFSSSNINLHFTIICPLLKSI